MRSHSPRFKPFFLILTGLAAGFFALDFRHASWQSWLQGALLFAAALGLTALWLSRRVRPAFSRAAEEARALSDLSGGLRRERDHLRAVIERMEEGILLLDGTGIIRAANPSAQRLLPLGPDAQPLEGGAFDRAVSHAGLCRWALDRGPRRLPVFQVDKGPEAPFDLLCHWRPLEPGDPNGEILLTIMDVTSFRNLDRAKTEFVANASHELKTPLSSIIGYTEAILDGALDNPQRLEHFLRKVHDNALRLQNLVKDLLSLSQLENQGGPARAEPLPVQAFAQAAWNQHRAEAERNGVRFENRLPENLIWNMEPRDLDLLLGNLIGNAVRYNRPGGKVQAGWNEGTLTLEVRDTGQGISPEMLPRVFERFYRGDQARARGDGTGLGLAIVKHAAQRYGIQVSAESVVGEGSRFFMEIPRERIGLPA